MSLWRWRCGSWGMGCSKCYHHILLAPTIPRPSLEAAGTKSSSNHC
jgi:hypothetical protein